MTRKKGNYNGHNYTYFHLGYRDRGIAPSPVIPVGKHRIRLAVFGCHGLCGRWMYSESDTYEEEISLYCSRMQTLMIYSSHENNPLKKHVVNKRNGGITG